MTTAEPPTEERHESLPARAYYLTFLGLCVLLVLTVLFAAIDLGPLNPWIAMAIGVGKALLIVIYFMHLRVSRALVRFIATALLLWLGILFALTLSDYFARLSFELPLF